MCGRRLSRLEVGATGIALTALLGEWAAHTLEYARLWGVRRAFDSAHLYMGPTGVVLVLAALAAVHSTARLARVLNRRLAELRHIETGGFAVPEGIPRLAQSRRLLSVAALVAIVWATQCGLYLLQENVEVRFAHRAMPGLSVLAGPHALVPLVHLAVALGLVTGLWLTRRQVTRLAQVVRLAEARLRFVRRVATVGMGAAIRAWTPLDRWGMQLWSRPPPAARVA